MGDAEKRVPAAVSMILLGGLCGWRSARLAVGMTADDAEYHFRQWEAPDNAGNTVTELDRALALNPRYTAARIAKGLAEEIAGDRGHAGATLLHAAELDNTYLPRWTLANFYYRAGDLGKFWTWARRAAEMAYDPGALFQLCWQASADGPEILDRAIPPAALIRRQYFDFLLATKRWGAAAPLAAEIARTAEASDLIRLLAYCDGAILRGEVEPALRIWNALIARSVIPYAALDPQRGAILTNGDLIAQPLRQGFDWRTANLEGAVLSFDTGAHEMTISLEGNQPESCDFLEQYVPAAGGKYRLRCRYRTRDLAPDTGLSLRFLDAGTGAEFASGALTASPAGWRDQTVTFSIPAGSGIIRILLGYRRPAGEMRAEGAAVFSRFILERAD